MERSSTRSAASENTQKASQQPSWPSSYQPSGVRTGASFTWTAGRGDVLECGIGDMGNQCCTDPQTPGFVVWPDDEVAALRLRHPLWVWRPDAVLGAETKAGVGKG